MSSNGVGSEVARRQPLPCLTGVRFVAAFIVLFSHAAHTLVVFSDNQFWYYVGDVLVWFGMTLFFVLSGFVIHYNYGADFQSRRFSSALSGFTAARFARLFPMYFFCLIVAFATVPLETAFPNRSYLFPFYLTATQSWVYVFTDSNQFLCASFYPHAWSISTEIFFYLTYPLLVFPLSRIRRFRTGVIASVLFIAASFGVLWLLFSGKLDWLAWLLKGPGDELGSSTAFVFWTAYFCPATRFFEFAMGCVAAQVFLTVQHVPVGTRERRVGVLCLLAALVVLVAQHYFALTSTSNAGLGFLPFIKMNFLFAPAIAVLLFCCIRYPTGLSRFLNWKPMVKLGETSYSIYLLHPWMLNIFQYSGAQLFTGAFLIEWAFRVFAVIGFTLIVALGTYSYVELPARNWIRGFLGHWCAVDRTRGRALAFTAVMYGVPCLGICFGLLAFRTWQLPALYFSFGLEKHAKGNVDGALAEYDAALKLQPGHVEARYHRALMRLQKGNLEGAIADLDGVLAIDPGHARASANRANLYFSDGLRKHVEAKVDAAIADYTAVVKLQPQHAGAYYHRALMRMQKSDLEGALADLDRVLQINPGNVDALLTRSQIKAGQGENSPGTQGLGHE
jgi:peptidoglycan/LPS O-acetylase OafA/YrhL